jgi:membrane associated rhomboid family serine protease
MGVSETEGIRGPVTRAVKALLVLNVGVHFLQLVLFGTGNTLAGLAFDATTFPSGWWTTLTYMFVHAGLLHLALNMLVLWSFGPRLEETWGTRGFLAFYLWCGVGGSLTHLVVIRTGYLVGASAAIYGLMLAYATLWKDAEIMLFGVVPVRARWLLVWLIGVNIVYAFVAMQGMSSIAAFAHLGGLLFAWAYLHGPGGGTFARVKQRIASVPDDTGEMPRVVPKQTRRARERASVGDDVVARSKALTDRRRLPAPQSAGLQPRSAELNAVLDKISQYGLDSLTADERRVLEQMSRELKNRS